MTTPSSPYPDKVAWPVNWQASGLTGRFVDFNGDSIANAPIVLTPSVSSFTSQATNTVVIAVPRTILTDSNGSINVFVPATDDPDIQPVGWTYRVEEKFGALRTYNITAPVGQVLDLSQVVPTPPSDGVTSIRGQDGPAGPTGLQGVGVPVGGPAGTVLSKMSVADYDTIWLSVDTNGSIVGPSAYDLAVSNGFTGSVTAWLSSIRGEQGPPGVNGATGSAGTVGPAGPPGVSGPPGAPGKSAYEHAVSLGFIGSLSLWLETLRGPEGRGLPAGGTVGQALVKKSTTDYDTEWAAGGTGSGGASAYEVAVINGYVGTEPEWIASLEGPPGPVGAIGPAGPNGPNGAVGPSGPIGSTGLRGPQGIEGERGPTGATGPAGPVDILGSAENPVTDVNAARPTGITAVWWRTATRPTNALSADWVFPPYAAEPVATRNATLHPFTSDSPWNLPLANAATFEASTDAVTANFLSDAGTTGNRGWYWNQQSSSHPIYFATTADPRPSITDSGDPGRSIAAGVIYIPANATPADPSDSSKDNHMHVVQPDGTTLLEMISAAKNTTTGNWTVSRVHRTSLLNNSLGPTDLFGKIGNGTRAYGGSAIGGLIRKHESQALADYMNGVTTNARGLVPHVLAIALRANQLFWGPANADGDTGFYTSGVTDTAKQPGWTAGLSRFGFMKSLGYRWPASEQDFNGVTSYSGQVPAGSLFAIPPTLDIEATFPGTTTTARAQRALAYTLQDYGIRVVDRSSVGVGYSEKGGSTAFHDAMVNSPNLDAATWRAVKAHLRRVTNDTLATPNGGALGSARRVALAPALPISVLATESWTGAEAAAWPAQWSVDAAPAGSIAIRGNRGVLRSNATAFAGNLAAYLDGMTAVQDGDIVVDVVLPTVTAECYATLGWRSGGGSGGPDVGLQSTNGYFLVISTASGAPTARFRRVIQGTKTDLGVEQALSGFVAGTPRRMRFEMVGATLRYRVWATADPEPTTWAYTFTDPTPYQAAGKARVAALNGGAAVSRDYGFDNLAVTGG